ncbi:MAG: hypothetical protein ACD_45C00365G0013 [uncultured bacterium]|nr:MAG: hypothetical protein ACD_45C00365G0013 [uncultured bacterium]
MNKLRDALARKVQADPEAVIQACRKAGSALTADEEAAIRARKLEKFSDAQLEDRFNTKVLGLIGLSALAGWSKQQKE